VNLIQNSNSSTTASLKQPKHAAQVSQNFIFSQAQIGPTQGFMASHGIGPISALLTGSGKL
jgi:hypothetical protein